MNQTSVLITREDLSEILKSHKGNEIFAEAVGDAHDSPKLLCLLARYIQFNSVFGGGVANLAGQIAVRQNLFQDDKEELRVAADRSAEVSSNIFMAAVDEFDDRGTKAVDTHRTLAQATLKGVGKYFGFNSQEMNGMIVINEPTEKAMAAVCKGYGMNGCIDERIIFQAIGFHMGSEILADEEFRQLDGYFRLEYPGLVEALEATEINIHGNPHVAYYWVRIHTTVEADHFAYAVAGANSALQYYAGKEDKEKVKCWVMEGFAQFAKVHTDFMKGLLEA